MKLADKESFFSYGLIFSINIFRNSDIFDICKDKIAGFCKSKSAKHNQIKIELAIWKSRHPHLVIGIDLCIGIGGGIRI